MGKRSVRVHLDPSDTVAGAFPVGGDAYRYRQDEEFDLGVQEALDRVSSAPSIVDAMRLAVDVAWEAARVPGMRTVRVLTHAVRDEDELAAIAATHALAAMADAGADEVLVGLLRNDVRPFIREHAAWALAAGPARVNAIDPLLAMVVAGGFAGMIAQRTLERWSTPAARPIAVRAEASLLAVREPEARARVVETLGLVRQPIAAAPLVRVASDATESDLVRIAALSALGERRTEPAFGELLGRLISTGGVLSDVAALGLADLRAAADTHADVRPGPTVAQLFLHADLDPLLSSAGSGDNGGIATLLVRLGDALVREDDTGVERVLTLSRGSIAEAAADLDRLRVSRSGHLYGHVPLTPVPVPSSEAWPLLVTARRGIRRMLRAAGRVDVVHLRMADVGSLAASEVARELGIPVVFTLAPDPHAVIESLDRSGAIDHETFGRMDQIEHFWFRTRLVEGLAAGAEHTVLFPRPHLQNDVRRLLGIDLGTRAERHTIVPEGVDLATIDAARDAAERHAQGAEPAAAMAELRGLLEQLAPERRGLPLIVSIGRLHRVKGMATLVDAWARRSPRQRANLLIVGGNLERPSVEEARQLELIEEILPARDRSAAGLVLAGHRANDVAALWLAAARSGIPGLAAPSGIYACASLKEEFGIALVEAMATGLLVVAPDSGGPATYVEDGQTGILTRTSDVERLSHALHSALDLAAQEGAEDRSQRARDMVRERFTIERMALALGAIYRDVAREPSTARAQAGGAR